MKIKQVSKSKPFQTYFEGEEREKVFEELGRFFGKDKHSIYEDFMRGDTLETNDYRYSPEFPIELMTDKEILVEIQSYCLKTINYFTPDSCPGLQETTCDFVYEGKMDIASYGPIRKVLQILRIIQAD